MSRRIYLKYIESSYRLITDIKNKLYEETNHLGDYAIDPNSDVEDSEQK